MSIPVRVARARVIHLRNDYKDLMSRIERGLHQHYATASSQAQGPLQGSNMPSSSSATAASSADVIETPFAKVNAVTPGSPAEQAGLRPGDAIRRFGHVNWLNHEKLSKIAETVQRNEDVSAHLPGVNL